MKENNENKTYILFCLKSAGGTVLKIKRLVSPIEMYKFISDPNDSVRPPLGGPITEVFIYKPTLVSMYYYITCEWSN